MKNIIRNTAVLFIVFISLSIASSIFAQPSPPPPPPDHGSNDDQPGGGAPIGGGVLILLGLGLGYGAKKLYGAQNEKVEETL